MPGRLEGKVAWITGAASGMGEAAAKLFAREGAKVALVDVDATNGTRVTTEITTAGGTTFFAPCDVTRESDVKSSLDTAVQRFGALHIIVNCAGIVHVKPLHEYAEADWDRLMAVNVKSIFFSVKHGIAHLRKSPRSYMVNIGSVGTFIGQPNTPAYTTSKGAVLQLSRSIALDYASIGLRCNCICPGITDTPMFRYHMNATPDPEAAIAQRLRRVPMGIALTPDDIARSILYFSTEDSAGITGTSLIVDGGYLAAAEWDNGGHTRFMDKEEPSS
jgi:NAD(P)-dependent dehydrogenase (short-subunit alcohol dehydrogenase family)